MSVSKSNRIVPSALRKHLPLLVFFFAVEFSIVNTWYITGHILDSDASSEMVLAHQLSETGNLFYDDWLTSLYLREVPNENPFILITQQEKDSFEKSDIFSSCTAIYEDTNHCIYRIDSLDKTLFYW